MRDRPATLRGRSAAGALPRPVPLHPAHPRGGLTALVAAAVLALTTGVSLRSAHRLLPEPED